MSAKSLFLETASDFNNVRSVGCDITKGLKQNGVIRNDCDRK